MPDKPRQRRKRRRLARFVPVRPTEEEQRQQIRAAQDRFLARYALVDNLTIAAEETNIPRNYHYLWLKDDAEYLARFQEAEAQAVDRAELELRRRALMGPAEPVIYRGKIAKGEDGQPIILNKPSDQLLMFLLRARRPERYRDRVEHTGPGGGPLEAQVMVYVPGNGREDAPPPSPPPAPVVLPLNGAPTNGAPSTNGGP